jgi:hypothetical protein
MMLNQQIEFANGLQGQVVGIMGPDHFIMKHNGQYVGCTGDENEFSFCNEEDPWRDSIMDASCDIELEMQND